jgi:hypothetical protein
MASRNDYARLSAAVYGKTLANEIKAPSDWEELELLRDDPVTGFAASVFRHRVSGEIVIAYAGTNVDSVLDNDWLAANAPAALGVVSPQVLQAAPFYWSVLNRPDVSVANKSRISVAGHSLGGGRAQIPRGDGAG